MFDHSFIRPAITRARRLARPAIVAPALLLAAFTAPLPAAAEPLTASEILNQFNMVVFGDLTSQSNTFGRAYVGGNLQGGEFAARIQTPASTYDELIVGGNISGNIKVQNGGDATIGGGGTSGALDMNGGSLGTRTATFGGTYTGTFNQGARLQNQSVTIPDFETVLTDASTSLMSLAGSSATTIGNKAVLNLTPDTTGMTVYQLEAGFFNTVGEVDLSLNGATTVIVNVAGTNITLQDNFLGGPFAAASNVLWNFYEATSLTFGNQFFGSVLAPLAAVTNYNSIEGSLVAASLTQRGQLHLQAFEGYIPPGGSGNSIPLPGSLALFGLGLAAIGLAARRRKTATPAA